jgi:hypothetical protein
MKHVLLWLAAVAWPSKVSMYYVSSLAVAQTAGQAQAKVWLVLGGTVPGWK